MGIALAHARVMRGHLVVLCIALCAAIGAAAQEDTSREGSSPQQTLKERLSDKASDPRRVNDCKVPPEKRDGRKRPTRCVHLADDAVRTPSGTSD